MQKLEQAYRVRYGGPEVERRIFPRSELAASRFRLEDALRFARAVMDQPGSVWRASWAVIERVRA